MQSAPIIPTSVPGLDAVLSGGLSRHSLTMLLGPPGAGKTVLASQIIFDAARQGVKTIVVTSYSEGVDSYIAHLRSFEFFDDALIGTAVQVLTLESQLNEPDEPPASAIARTIRSAGAQLVLLDGAQNVSPSAPAAYELRTVLAALAIQIRYLDTTMLVTLAGDARDPRLYPELTVADGAVALRYTAEGRRHQRLLEVVKLRGRAQQPGLHSYRITGRGLEIFPRIESGVPPAGAPPPVARAPFQLAELDQLLGGGPNVGTTTLLAGAPGVGKTVLGLQWALAEAAPDAASLFVSFTEHAEQLERKAAAFGLDLGGAIADGRLHLLRIAPADLNPDHVASLLAAELASNRVRRLVIDDIRLLLHELGDRAHGYLGAMNDELYAAHVTGLYLLEIPPFEGLRIPLANTPLATVGDALVVVQQYEIRGALRRLLAVLRMRLSAFDRTLRELAMDERGIRILAPDESVAELLIEGARLSGGVAPTVSHPRPADERAAQGP